MNNKVFLQFVNAINLGDVKKLDVLMADDHIFIDPHGNIFKGKETMKKGWQTYFEMFPDYKIDIEEIFEHPETIVAVGFASGTYKLRSERHRSWKIPACWKCVVESGRVKLWQVIADSKLPFDSMQ